MRLAIGLLCAVAGTSAALAEPTPFKTGFDPAKDGLAFATPSQPDALGRPMGLVAIHRFLVRGQNPRSSPGDMTAGQKPQVLEHVVKAVRYARTLLPPAAQLSQSPLGDPRAVSQALEQMNKGGARQGIPALLFLGDDKPLVLFGWENQELLLYDPAKPGQTLRWPWDPQGGFGPDPRGGAAEVRAHAVQAFQDEPVSKELMAVAKGCSSLSGGQCVGFSALEARVDEGQDPITRQMRLVVTGKVVPLPGRPPAARVWAVVGGQAVTVNVLTAETFSLALPTGTVTDQDQVGMVAVSQDGQLAGFAVARKGGIVQ